jgi:putative membrane protein
MCARARDRKKSWTFLLGAGLLLTMPSVARSQEQPNQQPTSISDPASTHGPVTNGAGMDQMFVTEAASGGMAEVQLGKMATEKASSSEVKQFGQRMIDDHSKANDQLKQLAANKGLTLPNEPSAKDKATEKRLSKLSGHAFDKAYMADMLKDHQKDVAAFQRESTTGRDPEIKQFAAQTLPILQEHLKQAQSIEGSRKTSGSNGSSPQQ